MGAKGLVSGDSVLIGNRRLMDEERVDLAGLEGGRGAG